MNVSRPNSPETTPEDVKGEPLDGCHVCLSALIVEEHRLEVIPIGDDDDFFTVEVPVIRCQSCGTTYTDVRAEKLRQDAAFRHLGLLSPDEVKKVRINMGLSRKEFDEAFGIPPASMERWENGRNMQNRSMNTLLRALQDPETANRLDERDDIKRAQKPGSLIRHEDNVVHVQFKRLAAIPDRLEGAQTRSSGFQLRAGS